MEEALAEISAWTQDVLAEPLENSRLAARGRLALLLTGMPDQWQSVFLTPPPWPGAFVAAMRSCYLAAGPNFRRPADGRQAARTQCLWQQRRAMVGYHGPPPDRPHDGRRPPAGSHFRTPVVLLL